MSVQIPYGEAGMAAVYQDTYLGAVELFGGNTPDVVTENFDAAVAAAWPIGTVVGFTGNVEGGLLVQANTTGPVKPIGVTMAPLLSTATDLSLPVATSGCFNMAALTFHADYDTPAKKLAAFGAATRTLTNIKLITFGYAGVISNPTA